MKRILIVLLLAVCALALPPNLVAGHGESNRGYAPAVAYGRLLAEFLEWVKQGEQLLVGYTDFNPHYVRAKRTADHPIGEEGFGPCFLIREKPYDKDSAVLGVGIVDEEHYQLALFVLGRAFGKSGSIVSRDGQRSFNMTDGSWAANLRIPFTEGDRMRLVSQRDTAYAASLWYLSHTYLVWFDSLPEDAKGQLERNPNGEAVKRGLMLAFNIITTLSGFTIIRGNWNPRTWDQGPGPTIRILAEMAHIYTRWAYFLWQPPSPWGTRGNKTLVQRESWTKEALGELIRTSYDKMKGQEQKFGPRWALNDFIQRIVAQMRESQRNPEGIRELPRQEQFFYAPRQEASPPPPSSTSGAHASLSGQSGLSERLSGLLASRKITTRVTARQVQAYWAPVSSRGDSRDLDRSGTRPFDPGFAGGYAKASKLRETRQVLARQDGPAAHDYDNDVAEAHAEAAQTVRDTVGE